MSRHRWSSPFRWSSPSRWSSLSRPLALALTLILGLTLAGCGASAGDSANQALASVRGFKLIPGSPLPAPTQHVTETDGTTWAFDRPAPGRITLLYFGYTSCPDVCPLTMADLASALTRLPASDRAKVWVQFVSTDPHRDTSAQISRWLHGFDPTFHGGRAPIGQVIAAAKAYGVYIQRPKTSKHDYQVTHGAELFVLDPHGAAVGFFTQLAGSASYAAALTTLVGRYA